MGPVQKKRLDVLLTERQLAVSRKQAQALVMAGSVLVDGRAASKPAELVPDSAAVSLRQPLPYVSRGGVKLAHALDAFGIDVRDRVAVDVGASTGGFTDVLLQKGVARVYAVDVGYGQLDWRLRNDPRVVLLERTNIRHLESLPEPVETAVIDVSFISLKLVLPVVRRLLIRPGEVVALVKPQFEAGRGQVKRGGVVRDLNVHRVVLTTIAQAAIDVGYAVAGLTASPLLGPAGNREFLLHLRLDGADPISVEAVVKRALLSGVGGQS